MVNSNYENKDCYKILSPEIGAALREIALHNGAPLFPDLRSKLEGFRFDGDYILIPKSIKLSLGWLSFEYEIDSPTEFKLFVARYGKFQFDRCKDISMKEYIKVPPYKDPVVDPKSIDTHRQHPYNILDDLMYQELVEEYKSICKYFISSEEFCEMWRKRRDQIARRSIPKDIFDIVPTYIKHFSCGFGEYCMEEHVCYLMGICHFSLQETVSILGILPNK